MLDHLRILCILIIIILTCHGCYQNSCRAEYLLSSGQREITYHKLYDKETEINPRQWDMYKDQELDKKGYIEEVHMMDYKEAHAITGIDNDSTIGIRRIWSPYWIATRADIFVDGRWHYPMFTSNGEIGRMEGACFGIRPVISLKPGVYIESGEGIEGNLYVLGMEE